MQVLGRTAETADPPHVYPDDIAQTARRGIFPVWPVRRPFRAASSSSAERILVMFAKMQRNGNFRKRCEKNRRSYVDICTNGDVPRKTAGREYTATGILLAQTMIEAWAQISRPSPLSLEEGAT